MLSCVGVGLCDKVEISRVVSISPHNHGMGLAPVPYLFGGGWFRRGREPMCIVADPGSNPGSCTTAAKGATKSNRTTNILVAYIGFGNEALYWPPGPFRGGGWAHNSGVLGLLGTGLCGLASFAFSPLQEEVPKSS